MCKQARQQEHMFVPSPQVKNWGHHHLDQLLLLALEIFHLSAAQLPHDFFANRS